MKIQNELHGFWAKVRVAPAVASIFSNPPLYGGWTTSQSCLLFEAIIFYLEKKSHQ
jgi:hypothetical protein